MNTASTKSVNSVTGRISAALLLVGALISLFAACAGLAQVLLPDRMDDLRKDAETLTKLQSHLKALESRANNKGVASLEQLNENFLKGTDDNLILAELQSQLRSVILAKSGELISARNLPAIIEQNSTLLGLNLQLRGEVAKVQEILHAIESGSPYLWIKRAALRLDEQFQQTGIGGLNGPKLIVEIDVYGAKWATTSVTKDRQSSGLPK